MRDHSKDIAFGENAISCTANPIYGMQRLLRKEWPLWAPSGTGGSGNGRLGAADAGRISLAAHILPSRVLMHPIGHGRQWRYGPGTLAFTDF